MENNNLTEFQQQSPTELKQEIFNNIQKLNQYLESVNSQLRQELNQQNDNQRNN